VNAIATELLKGSEQKLNEDFLQLVIGSYEDHSCKGQGQRQHYQKCIIRRVARNFLNGGQTREPGDGSPQRGPGAEHGNHREHQRGRDKH